jgi:hypothetical protein
MTSTETTPTTLAQYEALFTQVVAQDNSFGTATAVKRGRDARWPYVPVIKHDDFRQSTKQVLGRAFATREEAIACAQANIAGTRANLVRNMTNPGARSLRQHYGLPRELSDQAKSEYQARWLAELRAEAK